MPLLMMVKPMETTMKRILILAGLLLSGCGTQTMSLQKPGISNAEFQRDTAQCEYEATVNSYVPIGRSGGIAAGIEEGMRHAQLENLCLRAKGYTLQPR